MTSPLSIAREAAVVAAKLIANAQMPKNVAHKGVVDLVTEVDRAAESAIIDQLQSHTPSIPILAEEGGGAWSARTRWIVDPLDGTTNFVHGFPCFGPAIALEDDGQIVAACTINVATGEQFWASRGAGAWCNEERLHVSETRSLAEALMVTGFPYDRRERAAFYLRFVERFLASAQGLRRDGAAAVDLTHIAAGRADGFWELGLQPWDVAGGVLMIEEAGGCVTDLNGGMIDIGRPQIVASNGWIHEEITRLCGEVMESEGLEWASQ